MKVDGNSAYVEKLLLVLTYRLSSLVSKSTVNPDWAWKLTKSQREIYVMFSNEDQCLNINEHRLTFGRLYGCMYGSIKAVLAVEGGWPSSLFLTSIDTLKYIPYTKLVNFHNKISHSAGHLSSNLITERRQWNSSNGPVGDPPKWFVGKMKVNSRWIVIEDEFSHPRKRIVSHCFRTVNSNFHQYNLMSFTRYIKNKISPIPSTKT